MAIAWSLLATSLAELGRLEEAAAQLELAEGAARDAPGLIRASVANNAGLVLSHMHRMDAAIAAYRRAIALSTELHGPAHISVATHHEGLAMALSYAGRQAEARAEFETALAILGTAVGDQHPLFAKTQNQLGVACMHLGDDACAERSMTAAIAVLEDVEGDDCEASVLPLGTLRIRQGRFDEAIALLERTWAGARAESRPPSRVHGELLSTLAVSHGMRGDSARALEYAERSRDVFVAVLGSDDPSLVKVMANIGNLQRELGRIDDSAASLAGAVELARRVLAPTDRARLNAEIELGITSLVQGDSVRALALARGVLAIVPEDQPTVLLAEGRFLLARALGRSSAEGREAARQSLAIYRGLGEGVAGEAALVEAWLEPDDRD